MNYNFNPNDTDIKEKGVVLPIINSYSNQINTYNNQNIITENLNEDLNNEKTENDKNEQKIEEFKNMMDQLIDDIEN